MKSNNLRRFIAVFICGALFAAALLASAGLSASPGASDKTKAILVAGDAISSGKGLNDRAGKSYGSLLAAEFGVTGGKYKNIAADNMSSAYLFDELAYAQLDVEDADIMIISTGADDIMSIITTAIELNSDDKMSYAKLLSYAADPDYARRLNESIDHTALLNAVAKYSVNIGEIIQRVEKFNPDIRIVFLSLYNPIDGFEALASLKPIFASPVSLMNEALQKAAGENGCRVIDLAGAFAGRANNLTNLTSLDTSPNVEGHKLICGLLAEYIASLPDLPDETTKPPVTTAVTTEPPVSGTDKAPETTGDPSDYFKPDEKSKLWIYIVIAVGAGGAGILVGAYSAGRKAKGK